MTGNLQAIGFLFTWVLGWGIGGSLIDAGRSNAGRSNPGVYPLEGGQQGTHAIFSLWTLLRGGCGVWLNRRWTRPVTPDRSRAVAAGPDPAAGCGAAPGC